MGGKPLTFGRLQNEKYTTKKNKILGGFTMLRKFALWSIVLGLSFLVQSWGWTSQGNAFLYLHLGGTVLILAILLLLCLFAGDGLGEKFGLSFIIVILGAVILGITLLATWGATQLFHVEFTVVYQIMTFGQCLCESSKSDD